MSLFARGKRLIRARQTQVVYRCKVGMANMKRCGAVWQRVGLISLETPMSLDRSQATLHFFDPCTSFFFWLPFGPTHRSLHACLVLDASFALYFVQSQADSASSVYTVAKKKEKHAKKGRET